MCIRDSNRGQHTVSVEKKKGRTGIIQTIFPQDISFLCYAIFDFWRIGHLAKHAPTSFSHKKQILTSSLGPHVVLDCQNGRKGTVEKQENTG